ncbi:amino acid ABC transporter permease [Streptomyces sp. CB01881]|uniref:amino acid ABC transporter permease n=1 Tax=Streptomyces sp. CB01881 TaxID=2078691 RepID=UPI000CDC49F6|nr:amino acid ABC transporter permease [Streptomyces sp. CB01881]AUY49844.1 amino acid ABC transporter permease [Streptomyces sp. CB01881]TYC73235.1 amino acid ABC transporter permease [Streptomyces sp. CB01881]
MTVTTTAGAPAEFEKPRKPERPAAGPPGRIDLDGLAGLRTVRARHPWRWAAGAAALVVLAQFAHGLATNPAWDWPTFRIFFSADTILRAVGRTVELTFYGTVLGFLLGAVVAAMRLSRSAVLQSIAWAYVWVFRSIPLIVQLVFWFNLSYLYKRFGFGIPFGPTFADFETVGVLGAIGAAVLGLGLHQAAFAAEIIRGGVIAVDAGQREAAAALGVPRRRQAWRIVLPQAMRGILPAAANEVISLFKGTSVVYVMAIGELFYQVQVVYGRTGRVVPLLMVATVWYVLLTTVLSIGQYYVERYFARGAERTPPPTPLQRARARVRALRAARTPAPAPATGGRS